MRKSIKRLLSIAFATVMFLTIQTEAAQASVTDVTLKDVQTIVRSMGFLENKKPSNAVLAIIHNPSNSESLQNARQLESLIKKEKKDIEPRLVSVSGMAGLAKADFAFVTAGLQPFYGYIRTALNKNKVLSFTLDRACVRQDCCTVYINSKSRVEIIVNKTVADTIEARFKPIFLMMVTVM